MYKVELMALEEFLPDLQCSQTAWGDLIDYDLVFPTI